MWADTRRVHPADFHGQYYDVAGALPAPRPPQGHPVLAQAGSSVAGIELAGEVADVVFTPQRHVEAGLAFREKIDAAAALQQRGLHRSEYTGTTLRVHLGLPRPELSNDPSTTNAHSSQPDITTTSTI